MKAFVIGSVLVLVFAVVGVGWRESSRARETRAAVTARQRDNLRISAAIAAAEQRRAAAESEAAAQQNRREALEHANAPKPPTEPKPGSFDPVVHYRKMRERERDPKVQAVRLAALQAGDRVNYGTLFRRLGLSPEQIDKFSRIMLRRREQVWDLHDVLDEAAAQGPVAKETQAAVAKLRAEAKAECESAQRELLGELGYRELREYERSLPARTTVSDIAGAAVLAGSPFSVQQAEQLTAIVANASSDYREGRVASDRTIDWTAADAQARGVLSAEQWEFFRAVDPPTSPGGRFRGGHAQQLMERIARAEEEREKSGTTVVAPGG
ncbi:hypothetical protein [Opitutus terrae]|uniref:Uncharacterized protein n=1 Tax=Opitutus terrae (strain DSM 11246 / JCM 15787 / PB90-1) TaxID=452637 RepID=B1ZW56_OPITP|nr:hypothetical protein [Opitutus terrae]ACB76070.1 hypothetical protein Oter_2789 [Opitutus terrae PB90-1]